MATRKLEVLITGDASSLNKALGKTETRGKQFAKTMGKAGVAGALLGLGAAMKVGISEFMEAEKVTAQTNAVIKSTGGIAKVSAKEVSNLAETLMKKSGVDDEVIASGENMLLTFTKIRNEVGEGNDIFDQATRATLDLSVAMGKDMQSSAILVGKALNDPLKGMNALSRAGVQLTEDQKATIKQMVKLGDTAGAQKVILKELETQFGGSAEAAGKTFSGQLNILKETFSNMAGEIMVKVVPLIKRLAETLFPAVLKALEGLTWFINNVLVPAFGAISGFIQDTVIPRFKAMVDFFKTVVIPGLDSVANKVRDDVLPMFRRWADLARDIVAPALEELGETAKTTILETARVSKENEGNVTRIWKNLKSAAEDTGSVLEVMFDRVVTPALDRAFGMFKRITDVIQFAIPKAVDIGLPLLEKLSGAVKTLAGWLERAVKWLDDMADKIPKLPSIDVPFIGGTERGPRVTGPPPGVTAGLGSISSIGQQHGLVVTSGFRPGDPGDHGRGKALDISNTYRGDPDGTPQMDAAFLALASMAGQLGLKDLLYTPGLWKYGFNIDNGRRAAFSVAGHGDHIHASVFDQGGWLKPGLTLAYNGTGRAERVVGPNDGGDIVIQVDGETLARVNRRYAEKHASRNRF